MKKVLSLIVLISFIPLFIFCEEDIVNNGLLNFDVKILGFDVVNSLSDKTAPYNYFKKWTPYQGITPISEQDFFTIAGYSKEADAAKREKSLKNTFGWAGIGLFVAGLATFIHGINIYESAPIGSTESEMGNTVVWIGLSSGVSGIYFFTRAKTMGNWATVGQAQLVADEYNAKVKSAE